MILKILLFSLLACLSGFFKPTQGDEPCMQCPINSRTTSEGAINCVCRNGYYRTDSDPLQMPCTSMYGTEAVIYELANYLHIIHRQEWKTFWRQIWTFWHTHVTSTSRRAPGSKDSGRLCNSKQKPCQSCPSHERDADMLIVWLSTDLTQQTSFSCPSSTSHSPYSKPDQRLLGQGA